MTKRSELVTRLILLVGLCLTLSLPTSAQVGGSSYAGTNRFVVTGYGFSNLSRTDVLAENSFSLGFNPIILYQMGDNLLFEGEIEFEVEDGAIKTALEYAQADWLVNDYITVVAGKWLTPFGVFAERIHPAWINKLPTFPLPFEDERRLIPFTQVGLQVRGGMPLTDNARLSYAAYATNGIKEVSPEGKPKSAVEDNNKNKTLGGRLAAVPIAGLEIGGSIFSGKYDDDNELTLTLAGADAEYHHELFDLRGEFITSLQDMATAGEALKRSGAYAQVSLKLSFIPNPVLNRTEAVLRYSFLDAPEDSEDLSQVSVGANYMIFDSAFLRFGYDVNIEKEAFKVKNNLFTAKLAVGF